MADTMAPGASSDCTKAYPIASDAPTTSPSHEDTSSVHGESPRAIIEPYRRNVMICPIPACTSPMGVVEHLLLPRRGTCGLWRDIWRADVLAGGRQGPTAAVLWRWSACCCSPAPFHPPSCTWSTPGALRHCVVNPAASRARLGSLARMECRHAWKERAMLLLHWE